jgi:membrane-bound serine protease (ClpP class)
MTEQLSLAYALILVGCLLLALELVLFAHGILAVLGLSGVLVGAVLVIGQDPTLGFISLLGLFVAIPALGRLLLNYWPHSPMGRRFLSQLPGDATTVAKMPSRVEHEQLLGRYGKTVTSLHPSGASEFDGRRVDTVSEGPLIEAGQWVRCVEVAAGRVVVRQSAPPAPGSFDDIPL